MQQLGQTARQSDLIGHLPFKPFLTSFPGVEEGTLYLGNTAYTLNPYSLFLWMRTIIIVCFNSCFLIFSCWNLQYDTHKMKKTEAINRVIQESVIQEYMSEKYFQISTFTDIRYVFYRDFRQDFLTFSSYQVTLNWWQNLRLLKPTD